MAREEEILASCCSHVNIDSSYWKAHPTQANTAVVFVAVNDHLCGKVSLIAGTVDMGGGLVDIEVRVKESDVIDLNANVYEKIDVAHGATVRKVWVSKNTACTLEKIGTQQDPGYTVC